MSVVLSVSDSAFRQKETTTKKKSASSVALVVCPQTQLAIGAAIVKQSLLSTGHTPVKSTEGDLVTGSNHSLGLSRLLKVVVSVGPEEPDT